MRARLSQIEKRYGGKSDEQLEALIAEKQAERRAFSQKHARGPFPETSHQQLSKAIEEARVALDAGLAQVAAGAVMVRPSPLAFGRSLSELASLDRIANDAAFEAKLRAAIDAAAPPMAKQKADAELTKFDSEIEALETELKRREVVLRRAEIDAELAGLGGKTA
jgi:hypothetical protein